MKKLILDAVSDLVYDFLVYDREDDEELPRGSIQDAIKNGKITTDEIIEKFRQQFNQQIKDEEKRNTT